MESKWHSANLVMGLLESPESLPTTPHSWIIYVPTLLRFLEFCEDYHRNNPTSTSVPQVPSQFEPEIIALRYLRLEPKEEAHVRGQAPLLVSVLTRVLRLDDRLRSRALGLELFAVLWTARPSLPLYEGITPEACARLVEAIGNPLQLNEPQPSAHTGEVKHIDWPDCSRGADQFNTVGILLGLTLSDGWQDHLRPFNFASCHGIMSRECDRRQVLDAISRSAKIVTGSVEAQDKSAMLLKAVDLLKGLRNYGAVQLMLLHIWSSNGVYSFGEGSRKWLERETFELFRTYRAECLGAFTMHIKEGYDSRTVAATTTFTFRGAGGTRRRVRIKDWGGISELEGELCLQAVCRLGELYQAIGWNPGRREANVSAMVQRIQSVDD